MLKTACRKNENGFVLVGHAALLGITAFSLLVLAPLGKADIVTNGGFESNGGNGQLGFNTFATDWSVPTPPGSYTFLFAPGTADTTGANGEYGGVAIWGPGNGVANGLPATSPAGGYYIAQDGAFQQGAISQTLNGLTTGASYEVSFWWAAAQQEGFTGSTFNQWQVSFGSQTQSTPVANIPSQGFSGWMRQSFTFTADNTSDVLSFLANGGPGAGLPPFALLDGVSVNPVPEPVMIAPLAAMVIGLAFAGRKRFISRR
jgi:hypothetical protein